MIIENYLEPERLFKKKNCVSVLPRRPFPQLFIFNKLFLAKEEKKMKKKSNGHYYNKIKMTRERI